MKKLTTVGIILLVVVTIASTFLFLQSKTRKPTNVDVSTVQVNKNPPLVLLATGKKLGVNFSDQVFAKQTKCYDDPFQYYNNPKVTFRAICYNSEALVTDIVWVRKGLSLNDFIKRNIDVIAKERALKGIKNTDKKSIVFLEEKNGISYHKVSIGDDFEGVQGTLYLHTQEADTLGLTVVIMVKGKNAEAVKNRMEKIKSVVTITNPLSFIPHHFILFERAFAQDGGDGTDGGTSSDSPGLSASDGSAVTDGSGNAVGTGGGGTSNGSNGGGAGGSLAVNGVCSTTHYGCTSGTSANNVSEVATWTWSCTGVAGGLDASCTENKPLPTGSLGAAPSTCKVATGASTCPVTLTWSTNNPQGASIVTRDGTAGSLFSGDTDSKVTNVPYEADGSVVYRLYNNSKELDTVNVLVSCASGSYDSTGHVCADPQVVSATVKG